jgi:hypothetical protein
VNEAHGLRVFLDVTLHASAITLVGVTDGSGRDVTIRRAMRSVEIHDVTAEVALAAGLGGSVVLTSDPGDLERLLMDTGVRVGQV